MIHDDRFELANRIVEATIREFNGNFRKGRTLRQFYRDIRDGKARVFVPLRDDADDFVGILFDATGEQCRFELWLNLESRDDGPPWCTFMYAHFRTPGFQFTYRSPKDPIALTRRMGLSNGNLSSDDEDLGDTEDT